MEDFDLDQLKCHKIEGIITDDEYISRILHFAEEFLIKDLKLDILGVVQRDYFGGIFAAMEQEAWVKSAVKVVMRERCSRREIEDWSSLKHPSILRLLYKQYVPRIDAYIFVTELCNYTLEAFLDDKWFLRHKRAPTTVKKFLREILQGLDYLHHRNISYINLTAKNMWISNDFKAVIINLCHNKYRAEAPKK